MMLLAALLVFSFAGCDDDDDEEKKAKVVKIQPTGTPFPVSEENFTGDYARFQMQVLSDKTYEISVTSVDADANFVSDVDFQVGTYASEEDMLDNSGYVDDVSAVGGVVLFTTDGVDFYGKETVAGEGIAYFDIFSEHRNFIIIASVVVDE